MDVTKLRNDKIQESSVAASKLASTQKAATSKEGHRVENSPVGTNDEKVRWSPDAQLMSEALGEVRLSPDARADRVADLKARIKNGTYAMDAQKIAERMIESSLEDSLLSRRS
jgi:negative regulator of flagellin synthesis FlgM